MPESKRLTTEQLYAARDAEVQQAKAILAQADKEDRELTAEEDEQLAKHRAAASDFKERGDRSAKRDDETSALEQIEEAANAIPPAATQSIVTKVHESLRDDPKVGYGHLGDYAVSVYKAHSPMHSGYVDKRLNLLAGVPSGRSQDDGSGAGFLVPPAFSREISFRATGSPRRTSSRSPSRSFGRSSSSRNSLRF
jgi:hypothetical protein